MATLTLTPTSSVIKFGQTQKFTATVSDAPEGSTIEYVWSVDGANQAVSTNTFDYKPSKVGKNTISVVTTVKVEGEEDTSQEASTELTTNKATQSTTVVVSPLKQEIVQDQNYSVLATVTGAPAGASIKYTWSNGKTSSSISEKALNYGELKFTCAVAVTHPNFEDYTFTTAEAIITVTGKPVDNVDLTINAMPESVKIGEVYTIEALATTTTSDVIFEYLWDTGETTSIVSLVATGSTGSKEHEVTVIAKHPRYLPITTKRKVIIDILPADILIPKDKIQYVHPLPHRGTAFIWAGWWIMDEIEKITNDGGNWKQPPEDNPYYYHLLTLAKMLVDFPEVDVQESRHGRFVHRSALELGIIY